jgi:F-type H+-transporting ATPase subunit gamma
MAELRELQRTLDSVKALGDIVNAMRNLAAIYVRRAESALDAIRPYSEVVETSLAVLLKRTAIRESGESPAGRRLALVFASDQGLCGTYNESVVQAALSFKKETADQVDFLVIGRRGHEILTMRDAEPVLSAPSPTGLEGIKIQVPELAADIFEKYVELGAVELYFIYNAYEGMGRFRENVRRVLPPTADMLSEGRDQAFRGEPLLTAAPTELLGSFIEEYFFIELYRALLESHCSENGARLLSMTSAGSNIEERLLELTRQFQAVRQDTITAELLDVVGGAEALRQSNVAN